MIENVNSERENETHEPEYPPIYSIEEFDFWMDKIVRDEQTKKK